MAEAPPAVSLAMHELASRIYADLAVRAAELTATSIKMQTSPENLARLSFKLAAVFGDVERELNAASLPKNQDFKLDSSSIASWSK
jgi:hypothetical protein